MLEQLDTAIGFVVVMLILSLIITAIVQAVSALLDLRGKNLVRALSDLLTQIDSSLSNAPTETSKDRWTIWFKTIKNRFQHPFTKTTLATTIAEAVTRHPIVAQTFTRAKAIRKDELLDILRDISSRSTGGSMNDDTKAKLKQVLDEQVPGGPETISAAEAIANTLASRFPTIKDDLNKAVIETLGKVSRFELGIDKWFDTVMDRSSDIFTRWMRSMTVTVSFLLIILLQIDAGLILHQISSNAEIKAGLTKISDTALSEADGTLGADGRATAALKDVAAKHQQEPLQDDFRNAPPMTSCVDGRRWIEDYAKQKNSDLSQIESEFVEACQQRTVAVLNGSAAQIGKLRQELLAEHLQIVPDRIGNEPVFGNPSDSLRSRIGSWFRAYTYKRHLLGTLCMIVLLSLGAPFWYNALSQLSNLRPIIANKIDQESAAS